MDRAVTFVPGAAGAGAFWAPVVERLPTTWQIRVLDLPGLGRIPRRADVASYSDLVDYVARTIETPTALVAQSMGAFVVLELALRYPLLVTHLVLVAATGGVDMAAHGAADWREEYRTTYPHAEPWASASVPDLTGRLGTIKSPVLLIWATHDALSPIGVAHTLASKLARTSFVSFTSDDHWVIHQFPSESAAAIESFLIRGPR